SNLFYPLKTSTPNKTNRCKVSTFAKNQNNTQAIKMILNALSNVTEVFLTKKKNNCTPNLLFNKPQKPFLSETAFVYLYYLERYYIIPGIPPPIGGIPFPPSSLMSTKAHSVVKIIPATEAAFSKATRVTFFGSMIPAESISTYSSVLAL